MIQLGILDDHELFRTGVIELLTSISSEYKFNFSSDQPEQLYLFLRHTPLDLLLLDINLDPYNGIEILEKLRKEGNSLPIVMLTMHDQCAYVKKFIEAGANGYVLKSVSPDDLTLAIQKVLKNGFYLDEKLTISLVNGIKSNAKANPIHQQNNKLTEIETETLILICEGYTAQEISEKIYKSPRTIEGYRQRLLDKTDSKNIAALVSWAFKNNLVN